MFGWKDAEVGSERLQGRATVDVWMQLKKDLKLQVETGGCEVEADESLWQQ